VGRGEAGGSDSLGPQTASVETVISVCDSASNTLSASGPDGLPEQKIFPGIVHERAQRGNVLEQPIGEEQMGDI
jgi:AMP deaminase